MNRGAILSELPPPNGRSLMIEKDQRVSDIISLILYAHKQNVQFYDQIAAQFWKRDVYETCENLWNFCKKNILYEIEGEDYQTVRSPQRILQEGYGDCKHYASFIGGCLSALQRCGHKINWCYRFASYKIFNSIPGHVFIVVTDHSQEIWVDPVLDSFDYHKSFVNKIDRKVGPGMTQTLGKIGCECDGLCDKGCNNAVGAGYGYKNRGAIGAKYGYGARGAVGASAALKSDLTIGGDGVLVVSAALGSTVIGIPAAAVCAAVGGVMELVGGLLSSYKTSTEVRWLTQLFQYYVLGQGGVTSDSKVNEGYTLQSQAFFYMALGVPIYDRYRFNSIHDTSHPIPQGRAASVAEYLSYPDTKNVDPMAAGHAYDIAQTMLYKDIPGGWADFTPANVAAPEVVNTANPAAALSPVASTPISSNTPILSVSNSLSSIPSWVWIAAVIAGVYIVTK